MRKLCITRASPDHEELVTLYRKEKHPKLKERFHTLVLMHEIQNCTQVAELMKRDRKTIQIWVKKFNEDGLENLVPRTPPGRPSRLTNEQKEELERDILTHPRELGYEFSNWEGKKVSYHLKVKFGVELKVRQCQNLRHELNLTLQRPRYEFPNADPQEQEQFVTDFKKGLRN